MVRIKNQMLSWKIISQTLLHGKFRYSQAITIQQKVTTKHCFFPQGSYEDSSYESSEGSHGSSSYASNEGSDGGSSYASSEGSDGGSSYASSEGSDGGSSGSNGNRKRRSASYVDNSPRK